MPPRRKAAAAASPPAPLPLDGCTITVSGKFDAQNYSHADIEQLITSLGGTFVKSVTKNLTHLVCTQGDYDDESVKVRTAKARDIPIVNLDWLVECQRTGTKTDADKYTWASMNQPQQNTNGQSQPAASQKKRPIAVANTTNGNDDDDDDEPKAKKTKAAKANGTTNGTTKANGKATPKEEPKAAKEEKQVAEGQFLRKKDIAIPVDDYCGLTSWSVYIDPSSGMIYDASLNQSNSANNNNKFYRVQVLVDPSGNTYRTWTRWGRVGEAGQNATLGNGSLDDAIKNFGKKFKDKSGLPWEKRGDNPKAGKYAFVERSYNPDSDDEDEEDDATPVKAEDGEEDVYTPPKCTLEQPIRELMELIFNQQFFQATMASLNYDSNKMPLGKLSKATITRGFQQLKDIAALMDDPLLGPSQWGTSSGSAMEQLSNTYYSVIPHAFGRNRPPIINNEALLKNEIELLESLSDMKEATELMKIDRKTRETVHPLDRQFQGLGMEEMTTLQKGTPEFEKLAHYLNGSRGATHGVNYDIQQIFRIERAGEKKRFDASPFASIASDRRLLWHGSRATNFGGILSQGLRIAPPEAPVSGYMFGKGIYLADISSKSAGYCRHYDTNREGLLLLCEAELGAPMHELVNASYNADTEAKSKGMYSTLGQGSTAPSKWTDAGTVHDSLKGIKMPDTSVAPGPSNVQNASLYYNEYICYDVAQVKLRYLFRVKM